MNVPLHDILGELYLDTRREAEGRFQDNSGGHGRAGLWDSPTDGGQEANGG